jgi:hypothetical protein
VLEGCAGPQVVRPEDGAKLRRCALERPASVPCLHYWIRPDGTRSSSPLSSVTAGQRTSSRDDFVRNLGRTAKEKNSIVCRHLETKRWIYTVLCTLQTRARSRRLPPDFNAYFRSGGRIVLNAPHQVLVTSSALVTVFRICGGRV